MIEQTFIAGRSNLRNKDQISGIRKRLRLVRMICVNGMSHLMRERKHTLQIILLVQKHIRMRSVSAPGIRAASLICIRSHVDPAVLITFTQDVRISLSHRRKCLRNCLLRFLIRDLLIHLRNERHIQIVHMKMLHTKNLLAQSHITVQIRQMTMYRLDQIVINSLRNIALTQMHGTDTRVLTHFCIEAFLLQIADKHCSQCITPLRVRMVHTAECFLSKATILVI